MVHIDSFLGKSAFITFTIINQDMEFDGTPLAMSIKILQGTNIKGSKPAPNTFFRVQFADFDFKDVCSDLTVDCGSQR